MKILHLSKDDIGGGAGKAAYRLHQGLREIGVESWMLVMEKRSDDDHVLEIPKGLRYFANKLGGRFENLLARWFLDPGVQWDLSLMPSFLCGQIKKIAPDVVNLHWINRGVISVGEVGKIGKPIVWTFHDMWAATSGYHYYGEFLQEEYYPPIGEFSQNASSRSLAAKNLEHKAQTWKDVPIQIVCPSLWLQNLSKKSDILTGKPIHHIPYGLDLEIYRPRDRKKLRVELDLPVDKKLILFGAASSSADLRKGSDLLLAALKLGISSGSLQSDDIALVVFGHQQSLEEFGDIEVASLGYLSGDEDVAKVYSSVDLFVAPSREDNLPNTVLESMASGVPVVAFEIGGMPDMIEDDFTGYLSRPFCPISLLNSIMKIVNLPPDRYEEMSKKCREKALREYPLSRQAKLYKNLYESLLD